MGPFVLLVMTTVALRVGGLMGVRALRSWAPALRIALAVMFLATGATHFSVLRDDFAAMLPPPLTDAVWPVYLTGGLEIAGALGLLLPRWRRPAAVCLVLLLLAMFPANVYAARHGILFQGEPPVALWLRAPIQLWFMVALWASAIRRQP